MIIGQSKRARRLCLSSLIGAGLAALVLSAKADAQPVTPQTLEQHYWNAFITYVTLYQRVFLSQTLPHPTGMAGGGGGSSNEAASTSGPPGAYPNSGAPPPSSSSPPVVPFGGLSFSFGGGRGDDRRRGAEDQRRWEQQVDIMFPPTPRDPNIANQPPPSPPPSPPQPTLSQGTLLTPSGGTDIGQGGGALTILMMFVTGDWGDLQLFGAGDPPPPMMSDDTSFDTPVGDVVPIAGDSSPPSDDVM